MFKNTTLNISVPGVLANDSDPNLDPLTASLVTSPGKGTVSLAPNGQFIYTPEPDFTGTDVFRYEVSDGQGGFAQANVSIFVDTTSTTPAMAWDDSFSATENVSLAISAPGVLSNDDDLDGTFTTTPTVDGKPVVSPSDGTLVELKPNGSFIYTPDTGFTGKDSFIYRVTDGVE